MIDYYPEVGVNFYRLKIWNNENIFSYTAPVLIKFQIKGDDILLYPNPAKDFISLSIQDAADKKITLKMFDLKGALVLKNNWPAVYSDYFNEQINITGLSDGIYFYEIEFGENKKTGAIIVN